MEALPPPPYLHPGAAALVHVALLDVALLALVVTVGGVVAVFIVVAVSVVVAIAEKASASGSVVYAP